MSQPVQTLRHMAKLARPNVNVPGYWDNRYAGTDAWREEVYEFLVPLLKEMEPGGNFSLIDVGCGLGDGVAMLRRHFPRARIDGADVSPTATLRARGRLAGSSFYTLDITRSIPERRYDYVVMVSVLEHLARPRTAVRNALRSARKAVVANTPYREAPIKDPDHYHTFDEASLAGFSPEMLVGRVGRKRITYVIRASAL